MSRLSDTEFEDLKAELADGFDETDRAAILAMTQDDLSELIDTHTNPAVWDVLRSCAARALCEARTDETIAEVKRRAFAAAGEELKRRGIPWTKADGAAAEAN